MIFDFRHAFSKDDAKVRLEALGDYLHNRHGISITWDGYRAAFNGRYLVIKIEGELLLEENLVHCDGKDPGVLWRKKATDYLKKKLGAYLDPATSVEELPRGRE